MDIKIPQLGEGASTGSVINILVKEGEKVEKNQTVIELENEKAVAPIPAVVAGTIEKILVSIGEQVSVGQSIMTLSGGSAGATASAATQQEEAQSQPAPSAGVPAQMQPAPAPVAQPSTQGFQYQSPSGAQAPAAPSIRKLAREIGLDLSRVRGTERGGRITLEDVRNYILFLQSGGAAAPTGVASSTPKAASVDFSKWGPITKKPVTSLRKKIGEKMHESWSSIPHVTQNDEVDITDVMATLKKNAAAYEKAGTKLTVTAVILKACVVALQKFPQFNSSLDRVTSELILKKYYHLGVAVDTEQGLIVPVLRDVDKKDLLQISKDLSELAQKTRDRKVGLDDLKGGTFTISNLGGIGGAHFTPIINAPEVAILGVSRAAIKPVVRKGKIVQRAMMPISVSYDHRVIDGADGARFIRELATVIENFDETHIKLVSPKPKGKRAKKKTAGSKK